jgi:F-type H+-transporting ATPase subunit b
VEFSWSTFLLEIINFMLLIWILKHFFFSPVREIISRRQATIDKRIEDAETLQAEAQKNMQRYQKRLSDWEAEKHQLRRMLERELESEKAKRLSEIATQVEKERERSQVAEARQTEDLRRAMEEKAMRQGAAFASRLLQATTGAETESRLIERVLEEMNDLAPNRIELFQATQGDKTDIHVTSAYPLTDQQQQQLRASLARLFSTERPIHFEQDLSLMAGIQITTGNWILGCNLKDELAGFAEFDHDG